MQRRPLAQREGRQAHPSTRGLSSTTARRARCYTSARPRARREAPSQRAACNGPHLRGLAPQRATVQRAACNMQHAMCTVQRATRGRLRRPCEMPHSGRLMRRHALASAWCQRGRPAALGGGARCARQAARRRAQVRSLAAARMLSVANAIVHLACCMLRALRVACCIVRRACQSITPGGGFFHSAVAPTSCAADGQPSPYNAITVPRSRARVPRMRARVPRMRARVPIMRARVPIMRLKVPRMRLKVPIMRLTVPRMRLKVPIMRVSVLATRVSVPTVRIDCARQMGRRRRDGRDGAVARRVGAHAASSRVHGPVHGK